jgi:hypothetical protein
MKSADFSRIAILLGREHKVQVVEGNSWAANIETKKVFYKKEDIYNLAEDHILGLLLHEVAHVKFTSSCPLPQKNPELIKSATNVLEDIFVERRISADYPNAGEVLQSTRTELLDILCKNLPKMKSVPLHEKSLLYACVRFEGRGFENGKRDYEKIGDMVADLMIQNSTLIFERQMTKDLLPLAKEIVDILIKFAGEPTEEEKRKMMREAEQHGHANESQQQTEARAKVINSLKAGRGWKGFGTLSPNVKFIDEIADQASMIGKKLRTVLKRNNSMEFAGRYRSGKLMPKRFVRVRVLKDRRPFARRIVKSNQSYAFAVAADVSGSMWGGGDSCPGNYALSSMFMVSEALRMAGVPRSMIIFGEQANVVSPMGKSLIEFSTIANENSIKKTHPGSTRIDAAIDACRVELEKVRAERKIAIILTDGSSDLFDMQQAYQRAVNSGIEPLGITLGGSEGNYMDRTFSKEKNRNLKDTGNHAQIGTAFIDILKTSITTSQ